MIISVTEIETFLRCRRRWDYQSLNRQMLSPIINAPALVVGSLVHLALAWWRENPDGDPVEQYAASAALELLNIIEAYTDNVGVSPTREELEPVDNAITLGKVIVANYVKVWGTPLSEGYTLVNNEQTLLVPIAGTEHQLEATLDALLVDPKDRYFVLECKTYGRTPSEAELNDKFQFLAYMWAVQQTGIKPRAMLYDGLLKVDHIRRGHTLADNFLRKLLVRSQAEIDEFGIQLAQIANEMANPSVALYKTVPVLGGCNDCSGFIKLCRAQSRGESLAHVLSNYVSRDYKAEGEGWHRSKVWAAASGVDE